VVNIKYECLQMPEKVSSLSHSRARHVPHDNRNTACDERRNLGLIAGSAKQSGRSSRDVHQAASGKAVRTHRKSS
jgi:hypothetical protein